MILGLKFSLNLAKLVIYVVKSSLIQPEVQLAFLGSNKNTYIHLQWCVLQYSALG